MTKASAAAAFAANRYFVIPRDFVDRKLNNIAAAAGDSEIHALFCGYVSAAMAHFTVTMPGFKRS